jgi:thymidylate kinase
MTSLEQIAQLKTTSSSSPSGSLAVLRALFERLHEADIRYCHWKSNEHLRASFTGATDVDVLFDRRAIVPLTRILGETNFKRFVVKPGRGYPGIEDYVGFDAATGTLTHLHVHYQLTLGEKFLKGHRLPWEELYLATRVWDEEFGLYVADPHVELVALLVRAVMKLRTRDGVVELLGTPYFRGGLRRELRWLQERVEPGRLRQVGVRLVGEAAAQLVPKMLEREQPTVRQLRAFGRRAQPPLDEYRLFATGDAIRQMATREFGVVWWKLVNWYRGAPTKSTRTLPHGGLTVAFLGADGAGKSTLTAAIADWLSREVAVVTTYGGSGTGSASLPRRLMQSLAGVRRQVRRPRPAAPGSVPSLARLAWVLMLARERRRRAREARRAKGLGMLVLSDRLPQSQFPGWNDGPRLVPWIETGPRLVRAAARREWAAFSLAELSPPDVVLKLHVSPEVAARRKPETPNEHLRTGIDMVRRLAFPPTTRVVDLDAEQPLLAVLLLAKRAIWEAI